MKQAKTLKGNFGSRVWMLMSLVLLTLSAGSLASCGNSDPNSVTLEAKPELGDLGKFMSIDSKDVKLSLTEITEDGVPCIKLSSTIQLTVTKSVASNYDFDLDVEFLDGDMNRVAIFNLHYDIEAQHEWGGDYNYYLKAGSYRGVIDDTVKKSEWDSSPEAKQTWDQIREKAKYIVLKPGDSSQKFVEYTGTATSDDSSEELYDDTGGLIDHTATTSSAGSTDWDKVLDEYEQYVTKLASYSKKAMSGDMTALTQYASLLESAESLQSKLENAEGEMSVAQMQRLNKINAKLAQSMM